MGNNKVITLMDGYKEIGDVEMISAFELPDTEGKYIIYTKNEVDSEGNTIIYCGKLSIIDNKQFIETIPEGEEWEKITNILRTISKYSLEGENNV